MPNYESLPLGIRVECARNDMTVAFGQVAKAWALPDALAVSVLENVLAAQRQGLMTIAAAQVAMAEAPPDEGGE